MSDPNKATDTLIQYIQECIQKSYKTVKKKHNKKQFPRKIWINNDIIIPCNNSTQKLYNMWKMCRDDLE